MRNKKFWLVLKLVLIILFTLVIFAMPTPDNFRKIFRFIMLTVFVVSFILDLNRYKNKNG